MYFVSVNPKERTIIWVFYNFQVVIPSKAIKNEKIMETLMVQANSGMYRAHDNYFEECKAKLQKQDSRVSSDLWDSFDMALWQKLSQEGVRLFIKKVDSKNS